MSSGPAAATDPRYNATGGVSTFRPQYARDTTSALRLLRHLPASRSAVLEYLAGVLDVAVAHHLIREERRRGGSVYRNANPTDNILLSSVDPDDLQEALDSIKETLDFFVSGFQATLHESVNESAALNSSCVSSASISAQTSEKAFPGKICDSGKTLPRAYWAPIVAKWSVKLLGDLSSKHAARVVKLSGTGDIRGTLPYWLSVSGTSSLMELTTQCIKSLKNSEWHEETEICVSGLLDASMRHGPTFDWVVAHVGARFPDTVIARVFSVGLKEFWSAIGDDQSVTETGQVNLQKIPKINSVVGILDHLASADHTQEVKECLKTMVCDSIQQYDDEDIEAGSEEEEQSLATVPYLLYLAKMSNVVALALTTNIYEFVTRPGVAERLSEMVADWAEHYFPGRGALPNHIVNLVLNVPGVNGRDAFRLLLDLGGDIFESNTRAARDAVTGCRLAVELLLCDLLAKVHQSIDTPPLLKAVDESFMPYFLEPYIFSADGFQRKAILILTNILALQKGRTVAINALKHCLNHADSPEHIGTTLMLVKENEAWFPNFVQDAVEQCLKKPTVQFLDNVCSLVELQEGNGTNLPESMTTVTDFAGCLKASHLPLLNLVSLEKQCLPNVLRVFYYVPLPKPLSVSEMNSLCKALPRCVFAVLEESTRFSKEEKTKYITQIFDILSDVISNNHIACLTISMRTLLESAIKSKNSRLFGSRSLSPPKPQPVSQSGARTVSLFNENLKFGAMPTHPLGASTVFHAGVIGQGVRKPPDDDLPPKDVVDENTLIFVSSIFKMCHSFSAAVPGKSISARERQERSRESLKQLSVLLVDIVSPDVMYNGLPWPEEELTKVTKERDLFISKKFEENPILWKLLAGLAEARPSLCFCSVLLRALLAVQMSHWQTSVAHKSAHNPKQLEVTVKVLTLLSVGQFIPHPLDSVTEVLHVMHPFHVHCVLYDIWNYIRDNVPSPVNFTPTADGSVLCREFEPYKNYRQYCERLRLIMIRHISEVPEEYKKFFVDYSDRHDQAMKIAMEY